MLSRHGVNAINDETITELIRIVCYDQPIYEDMHLEGDEWLGLTLGVDRSTVLTDVQPMHDQAAILIQDNDSVYLYTTYNVTLILILSLQWPWLVWSRHSSVSQRVWVWWSCVLMSHLLLLTVQLHYPSMLTFQAIMELQVCTHNTPDTVELNLVLSCSFSHGLLVARCGGTGDIDVCCL